MRLLLGSFGEAVKPAVWVWSVVQVLLLALLQLTGSVLHHIGQPRSNWHSRLIHMHGEDSVAAQYVTPTRVRLTIHLRGSLYATTLK